MSKVHELQARAEQFAQRAARARERTARNTYLSLEQAYRTLAAQQARFDAAREELAAAGAERALKAL